MDLQLSSAKMAIICFQGGGGGGGINQVEYLAWHAYV